MVYVVGILAAAALGLGYVLQQRVAATMPLSEVLHWRLLLDLMRRRAWWFGIAAMVVGQVLSGLALQLATLAVVEPLISANLLFALGFSAALARRRVTWQEVVGAAVLSASLGVILVIGKPHRSTSPDSDSVTITLAVAAVVGATVALVAWAKRSGLVVESILLATAAGLMYGLQDAATRSAFVQIDDHGLKILPISPWLYIVVGSAVIGILLSQSAFKTARLDYSLPPIAAAEPVTGILLGICLLGDTVAVSVGRLAVEAACLAGMVLGAVLIAHSPNLASSCAPEPAPTG